MFFFCYRGSQRESRRRRRRRSSARFSKLTVVKKDQTTSTHLEEGLLFRSGDNAPHCDAASSTPHLLHRANYNIYVEEPAAIVAPVEAAAPNFYENIPPDHVKGHQPPLLYINSEEVAVKMNAGSVYFPDKLLHLYNQPINIIPPSELFATSDQQGAAAACKSATFPRNAGECEAAGAQTLPMSGTSPQQGGLDHPQPLEAPPPGPAAMWGRYSNLLESSVSAPGTLHEAASMAAAAAAGELSERALLELSRSVGPAPRAWFVSLDGKPAAAVRHSVIELQSGRPRPPSSNDTSLDSGVDMNEPPHGMGHAHNHHKRTRGGGSERPSPPWPRCSGGEELDLSSSESGTTATCTPDELPVTATTLGVAIPEEECPDTSSTQEESESRSTPPPRRLRKVRDKVKTEKRGGRHGREGRPLARRT